MHCDSIKKNSEVEIANLVIHEKVIDQMIYNKNGYLCRLNIYHTDEEQNYRTEISGDCAFQAYITEHTEHDKRLISGKGQKQLKNMH